MKSIMTQAREYLGFSRDEVADCLAIAVDDLDAFEAGRDVPDAAILARLSILYRRDPADLLKAGPDELPALEPDSRLALMAKGLPIEDLMELAMFSRFLSTRKKQRGPGGERR